MKMSVVRPTLPYLKKTLHFHSYRIKAHKQFLSELFPVTISNEEITSIVDNSTVNKKVEENIRKMRSLISASNLFYTTTDNRGLVNSFTVSNTLMRLGVVFCKWQQRINAFGAIFGFKKYQNDRHWHYIISTDCYTCTLTM